MALTLDKRRRKYQRWGARYGDYCQTLGRRGCPYGVRRSAPTIHYHIPVERGPLPRPWKRDR